MSVPTLTQVIHALGPMVSTMHEMLSGNVRLEAFRQVEKETNDIINANMRSHSNKRIKQLLFLSGSLCEEFVTAQNRKLIVRKLEETIVELRRLDAKIAEIDESEHHLNVLQMETSKDDQLAEHVVEKVDRTTQALEAVNEYLHPLIVVPTVPFSVRPAPTDSVVFTPIAEKTTEHPVPFYLEPFHRNIAQHGLDYWEYSNNIVPSPEECKIIEQIYGRQDYYARLPISKQTSMVKQATVYWHPILLDTVCQGRFSRMLTMIALKRNARVFAMIPECYINYTMCQVALRQDGLLLGEVPVRLINRKLCMLALEQNYAAFEFVPHKHQNYTMISKAISINPATIAYANPNKILTKHLRDVLKHKDFVPSIDLSSVPTRLFTDAICKLVIKRYSNKNTKTLQEEAFELMRNASVPKEVVKEVVAVPKMQTKKKQNKKKTPARVAKGKVVITDEWIRC